MTADPLRLLSFCRAIEEASDEGLLMLDRESLLAVGAGLPELAPHQQYNRRSGSGVDDEFE